MTGPFDLVLAIVVLTNFMTLGSSRLQVAVRNTAVQGCTLGALPLLLVGITGAPLHLVIISVLSTALRGVAFPMLLTRALRDTSINREDNPFCGPLLSMGIGLAILICSFWIAGRLAVEGHAGHAIAVSLASVFTGLFIIVSRRTAISQVLGYITLENAIYILGLSLFSEIPLLVELGVLLDIFVAVFVMGLLTNQLSQTFDNIETDRLNSIKG